MTNRVKSTLIKAPKLKPIEGGAGKSGGDPGPVKPLPETCPVIPLGVDGETCFYLDDLKQLRELGPRDHSRNGLSRLFGNHQDFLFEWFPQFNKAGKLDSFRPAQATDSLMAACAKKGVFSPMELVRGAGAWQRADGALILHCGDGILNGGRWQEPGIIGEHIYPAAPALSRPWEGPVPGGRDGPGASLLDTVKTWKWVCPAAPYLVIGWIACAILGGAIDWRPVLIVTGEAGTGKSSLLKGIKALLGRGILVAGDATPAGVYQRIGYSSLGVALDELERDEDAQKSAQILRMIRNAASGSMMVRGGADHKGVEFTLRNCFLASAIDPPSLSRADSSRVALLELMNLDPNQQVPDLRPDRMQGLGRKIKRRLVDHWDRWHDTWSIYRDALARVGASARTCDVFATLLAAYDLVCEDAELGADAADEMVEKLSPLLRREEDGSDGSDKQRCLAHLLTSLLPPDGPNRRSVGHFIGLACEGNPDPNPGQKWGQSDADRNAQEAHTLLKTFGLKIVVEGGQKFLAVANTHQGLARLFQGSRWAAVSGKTSSWRQTLARLPGAMSLDKQYRFDAVHARATLIPIKLIYDPSADETKGSSRQGNLGDADRV